MVQANIDTLEKMFSYVAKVHTTKKCLGTREILSEEDEVQPNGRVFKKYNMGDYKWKTFIEVDRMAACFGRGLRELGQEPKQNIVIFAETRAEWMIAAHGCFKQNIPIVTIYATLGDDGVIHGKYADMNDFQCECIYININWLLVLCGHFIGINETEVTTVITTHELLPKFKTIANKVPNVHTIIFMEDQLHKTETTGFKEGVKIIPFSQVIRNGSESKFEGSPPATTDVAIIMYTSGSTGTPKGVLLTHKNCVSTLKSFCDIVRIYPNDILIG